MYKVYMQMWQIGNRYIIYESLVAIQAQFLRERQLVWILRFYLYPACYIKAKQPSSSYKRLTDFNGISIHLGLFYASWSGERAHRTFIFTGFMLLFRNLFFLGGERSDLKRIIFKRIFWPTDGTLIGTTLQYQNRPHH